MTIVRCRRRVRSIRKSLILGMALVAAVFMTSCFSGNSSQSDDKTGQNQTQNTESNRPEEIETTTTAMTPSQGSEMTESSIETSSEMETQTEELPEGTTIPYGAVPGTYTAVLTFDTGVSQDALTEEEKHLVSEYFRLRGGQIAAYTEYEGDFEDSGILLSESLKALCDRRIDTCKDYLSRVKIDVLALLENCVIESVQKEDGTKYVTVEETIGLDYQKRSSQKSNHMDWTVSHTLVLSNSDRIEADYYWDQVLSPNYPTEEYGEAFFEDLLNTYRETHPVTEEWLSMGKQAVMDHMTERIENTDWKTWGHPEFTPEDYPQLIKGIRISYIPDADLKALLLTVDSADHFSVLPIEQFQMYFTLQYDLEYTDPETGEISYPYGPPYYRAIFFKDGEIEEFLYLREWNIDPSFDLEEWSKTHKS